MAPSSDESSSADGPILPDPGEAAAPPAPDADDGKPRSDSPAVSATLVEIGWIAAGPMDDADWQATRGARDEVRDELQRRLPGFRWQMPLVRRPELTTGQREQPVLLADAGMEERNVRHWDLAVVVTAVDLISHYRADAVAALSRSLETIVVSTARLDPLMGDVDATEEQRVAVMKRRLMRLVLHAIGHLGGLGHAEEAGNYMASVDSLAQLDQAADFTEAQLDELRDGFSQVADRRLEEEEAYQTAHPGRFYLASAWLNRNEIAAAIREARPWQFPFRLSRLTTAVISAMLVFLVTAEAWELAASQSPAFLAGLSLFAVLATTIYVILRQRLYVRRRHQRLTEQTVATNVSALLIVLLGMITTYGVVFLAALLMGRVFFTEELAERWSAQASGAGWRVHLSLASFVASLSLFIGALGASFESNHYFRHITFVDEEL